MEGHAPVFVPQNDSYWRIHNDMMRVQQVQAEHADRLSRLERRQEDDARLKSVWGTSSPFPGVLSGTPQQAPVSQPPADAFSNFDDDPNNLIASLHLDASDEPRRMGATSRANSVRFDESANQGWAHTARSSVDMISRTGSAFGHPLLERSSSHKSDGRHSSAVSVHSAASGRANSLGLDTNFGLAQSNSSPIEPPGMAPGLLFLGPAPSIIRCWLTTSFRHDSLLYAAVCSGSYKSLVDIALIDRFGIRDQMKDSNDGSKSISLTLYLSEAVPNPASSRPNSPAPQVPELTITFTVVDRCRDESNPKAIQIFLGCDALRAHHADILFSSNNLIIYDDDQCKLSIPLVRPEDEESFRHLCVIDDARGTLGMEDRASSEASHPVTKSSQGVSSQSNTSINLFVAGIHARLTEADVTQLFERYGEVEKCTIMRDPYTREGRGFGFVQMATVEQADAAMEGLNGEVIEGRTLTIERARSATAHSGPPTLERKPTTSLNSARETPSMVHFSQSTAGSVFDNNENNPLSSLGVKLDPRDVDSDTPKSASGGIWGNWRRESTSNGQLDWARASKGLSTAAERPNKDQGIKVLKPLKSISRSTSATQASTPSPSTSQSRFFDDGKRRTSSTLGSDAGDTAPRKSILSDLKQTTTSATLSKDTPAAGKPRANPIGGASAFPWLNTGGSK